MTTSACDVVVVGAGHAGCEAAVAAARLGAEVVLVTLARATIAEMPCNPAVGGIAKGHLVAEVDALGGLQGWAADRAGVHFRVLNASRGPAVWGPRAQCDKRAYHRAVAGAVERTPGLTVVEGEVRDLLVGDRAVGGVRLATGERLAAGSVILTTGTFLDGLLHCGQEQWPGGRLGERPSLGLGRALRQLGLELMRFKTGTPPRLHRDSLDYDRLEPQDGDEPPRPFSWRSRAVRNRCRCWLTRTPPVVREIVADNLDRSPLFQGAIRGVGPRYCPSIEDKVVRFPHHPEHTVFVEPEGVRSPSMYVNGLSTSLPRDVQERVVRAVPGLERAVFLRHGYAVEYDVVVARQVDRTLAVRGVDGLFLAGQLLGTSGYEEAAALGLVAGVNAVLARRGAAPFELGREEAYVGVLVDDLVSADHREPYRMLTARAEHRLLLGVDSARQRLMPRAHRLGLVAERDLDRQRRRWEARQRAAERLEEAPLRPTPETRAWLRAEAGLELQAATTWAAVLRRPDLPWERLAGAAPALGELGPDDRRLVVASLRYRGYVDRQSRQLERVRRLRSVELPVDLDPAGIPGLSRETVEALRRHRPRNLAEAELLAGVTPAAVAILAGRLGGRE